MTITEDIELRQGQDNSLPHIRDRFYKDVFASSREHVFRFYSTGATYANELNNSGYFPTITDINNISSIADELTHKFFSRVASYLTREQEIQQSERVRFLVRLMAEQFPSATLPVARTFDRQRSLQLSKQILSLVQLGSTRAVNYGFVSKARQLLELPNANEVYDPSRYTIRLAVKRIEKKNIKRLGRLGNTVVWVTAQDDKVCWKYCRPLEGRVFNLADRDTPIPPDDTHPNCRCRLFNIDYVTGNVLYG